MTNITLNEIETQRYKTSLALPSKQYLEQSV